MITATSKKESKTGTDYQPNYIFVLLTHKGEFVVGSANNAARRIAALNSACNQALPEPLSINRIVGVKERTDQRTLISVAKKFIDKYGEDKVIVV